MKVHILESDFSDNYFYLVQDGDRAVVIDPVDAPTTVETVKGLGLKLEWVVNTHFHPDHIAGDDEVLEAFPGSRLAVARDDAEVVSGNTDADIDLLLADGDTLEVGEASLKILETPGHTPGHISLLIGTHLFCGDTIFIGGAGNCSFGGDAGVLFRTFRDVLPSLSDDLLIYPGHDYSVRNLEFCLDIEPDNDSAKKLLAKARASDGLFNTTLGTERSYNPFFRAHDPDLIACLKADRNETWQTERKRSESDDEAAFRTIRALRNNW